LRLLYLVSLKEVKNVILYFVVNVKGYQVKKQYD